MRRADRAVTDRERILQVILLPRRFFLPGGRVYRAAEFRLCLRLT